MQAFLDGGGFEAFAAKRSAKEAEKVQTEADEKAEKKRAKREAKRLALKTADEGWAHVPIVKGGRTEQEEQEAEKKKKKKERGAGLAYHAQIETAACIFDDPRSVA